MSQHRAAVCHIASSVSDNNTTSVSSGQFTTSAVVHTLSSMKKPENNLSCSEEHTLWRPSQATKQTESSAREPLQYCQLPVVFRGIFGTFGGISKFLCSMMKAVRSYEICGYHSGLAADVSLLGCHDVSLRLELPMFRMTQYLHLQDQVVQVLL